jgi:superfamily II RNA helicase
MYQLKKRQVLLKSEIDTLTVRISEIEAGLCPENGTLTCPVERSRARKQLKRLRWKNKIREKDLLQKQIALATPKKCLNLKKCMSLSERLRQVQTYYQTQKQEYTAITKQIESVFTEYKEVRDLLEKLGYVKDREFFARGIFALELHVQEILVTEIAFSGLIEDTEPADAAAILAGIEFIPGKNTRTATLDLPALRDTQLLRHELLRMGIPERFCIWSNLPGSLAYAWYNGASFAELVEMTTMQPGDIFSIFRREIDLLRQIERAATGNTALIERIHAIRGQLDRDEIALSF